MIAYVGLGSNLGDRLRNIHQAIQNLKDIQDVIVLRVSNLYETEPVNCEGGLFMNAVAEIDTILEPDDFLNELLKIEDSMGRTRKPGKTEARKMDLDFLLYGGVQINLPQLKIPHPRMHERLFVLEPLCELNKDIVIPGLGKTAGKCFDAIKQKYS
jgi:2-amino-4-hydroxy-6-hydroxymethyldihydropteridine diphosphokinase